MEMCWIIGCFKHGVNSHLLSKVRESLRVLNALTEFDDRPSEEAMRMSEDEILEGCGGDYFQGIDLVGTIDKVDVGDLSKYESSDYIVMVTTSYKIREAHYNAFETMSIGNSIIPFLPDCYGKLKKGVKAFIWNANPDPKKCAWPATKDGQHNAWETLTAAATVPNDACVVCHYTHPGTLGEADVRAKHKQKHMFRGIPDEFNPKMFSLIDPWCANIPGYSGIKKGIDRGHIKGQLISECKDAGIDLQDREAVQQWLEHFPHEFLTWNLPLHMRKDLGLIPGSGSGIDNRGTDKGKKRARGK